MDSKLIDDMVLNLDKSKWKPTRLGDVSSTKSLRENNPSKSTYDKFVGSSCINEYDLRVQNWEDTSTVTSAMKVFNRGEYLLVRRSVAGNQFKRRAARADFNGLCSGDIINIREDEKYVSDGFLAYVLYSDDFWEYAISNASGSITSRVKWKDLADYEFLLPPKDQQAKLAKLLWAMDEVIEKEKTAKEILENLLQATINLSVSSDSTYDKRPLHTIANIQTGIAKNKTLSELNDVIEVPYLRVANVQDGYLDLKEIKSIHVQSKDLERYKVEFEDVLLTEGGDFDKLGRGYVWQNEVPGCVHQNHVFIIRTNRELLNPWYLSYACRSGYGKQYFLRIAKKTSNLASINSSQLKEFRVPLPPIHDQDLIVKKLKGIELVLKKAQSKITTSCQLQAAIINQVF